jgi:hypothetical protein
MEGAEWLAPADRCLSIARLLARTGGIQMSERLQCRIEFFDPCQEMLEYLHGRNLAPANSIANLPGRYPGQFVEHGPSLGVQLVVVPRSLNESLLRPCDSSARLA